MTDLAEFLLARIAEDEADTRWLGSCDCAVEGFPLRHGLRCAERVLAECAAKRRIVELHKPYQRIYGKGCDVCLHPRRLPPTAPGWPCDTLRLLALPYAEHPDYREEWRP